MFEGEEHIRYYAMIWKKSATYIQNKTVSYHVSVYNSSIHHQIMTTTFFLILLKPFGISWEEKNSEFLSQNKDCSISKIAIAYISHYTHLYKHVSKHEMQMNRMFYRDGYQHWSIQFIIVQH